MNQTKIEIGQKVKKWTNIGRNGENERNGKMEKNERNWKMEKNGRNWKLDDLKKWQKLKNTRDWTKWKKNLKIGEIKPYKNHLNSNSKFVKIQNLSKLEKRLMKS